MSAASQEIDWDGKVGYWLKDVPYVWEKYSREEIRSWEDCGRLYILPKFYIYYVGKRVGKRYLLKNLENLIPKLPSEYQNKKITQYFEASIESHVENIHSLDIRLNGERIYFPLIRGNRIPIKQMYNYLGVKLPRKEDIKTLNRIVVSRKDSESLRLPEGPYYSQKEPVNSISEQTMELESMIFYFWYLRYIEKHSNICMPVGQLSFDLSTQWNEYVNIFVDFYETPTRILVLPDMSEMIKLCLRAKSIRYIIIPIIATWDDTDENVSIHSNFLLADISDRKDCKLYIFDPNGSSDVPWKDADLSDLIDKLGLSKLSRWTFVRSPNWCPSVSFQGLEHNPEDGDYTGYCSIWTLWMIETIINNPHVSPNVIVRKALSELSRNTLDFDRFIRNYADAAKKYRETELNRLGIRSEFSEYAENEEEREKLQSYSRDKIQDYLQDLEKLTQE
jgi:hypothetical protein